MSMADEGEDREADVVEQPARKPDDMTAVLAVNFRKSRRVMFDCTVVMTMLRCSCVRVEILRLRLRMTLCICESKKSVSFAQKGPHRFMRDGWVGCQVVMSFSFEHHELGIGNRFCEVMSRIVVRLIGGAVVLVITHEHEGRNTDRFETFRMVMFLTRDDEIKIVLQRRDPGHAHSEKIFDQLGMRRNEILGPAGFDGVLADVALESQTRHVAAHGEGNAMSAGMRAAARSQDQFLDLGRMVEGEQLRDDTAHGMTADNRWLDSQMI